MPPQLVDFRPVLLIARECCEGVPPDQRRGLASRRTKTEAPSDVPPTPFGVVTKTVDQHTLPGAGASGGKHAERLHRFTAHSFVDIFDHPAEPPALFDCYRGTVARVLVHGAALEGVLQLTGISNGRVRHKRPHGGGMTCSDGPAHAPSSRGLLVCVYGRGSRGGSHRRGFGVQNTQPSKLHNCVLRRSMNDYFAARGFPGFAERCISGD